MKSYFATLALVLAASAAINRMTDPWAIMAGHLVRPHGQGMVLRVPGGPPQGLRQLQSSRAGSDPRPDLLVLGSSNAIPLTPDLFRPGTILKNLWVPGCDLEDMQVQWQACKEAGRVPARILILLERYVFNESGKDILSWDQALAVARFENRACAPPAEGGWEGAGRSLKRLGARGHALLASSFSYRGLRVAADAWGLIADKYESPVWMPLGQVPPYDFYFDGDKVNRVFPRRKGPDLLKICSYRRFMENYAFSSARLERFKSLVRDMACQGTRVLIVVPPLHPLARREIEKGIDLGQIETDLNAALKKLHSEGLFGLPEAAASFEALHMEDADFYDGNHFDKTGAGKLLKHALARAPEWRDLIQGARP